MDDAAPETPTASPPDPAQDQPAPTAPNNISVILHAVGTLLTYGRHLIDTVRQRAIASNFNAIAAHFGTANLSTIVAHLNRGILRAAALERLLLARAAAGQDIGYVARRAPAPPPQPAPTPTEPEQPAAAPPTPRQRAPRPTRSNDPELFMPTPEDLDRQVRRRPIGRTILEICLDLAVVPAHCHPAFWSELFDIMSAFGGSIATLMREKARRRAAFDKERDNAHDSNWDWVRMSRDGIREVLGFFIGEPPVNPLDPAAAVATAPP